ncbi:hypothetical protein [Convivina intestini]|uniref:YobI-like P-loop NTPase domain-containing protein n=1 Tax=Convivina intestini TaxID=1505726 RepID=A0A2U1D785_9LACO|nr:hypothetical protein [Convivina intestini]PVY83449.1 hypothetical protein C7384_10753 [Convivina intestini]CAH1855845.1 hypothetical protein R077811_01130 [Convivina intestini]SDC03207.1 hypothetical protein SAMN05216341_11015 [Leuconostocaceae bacterium R-53105]
MKKKLKALVPDTNLSDSNYALYCSYLDDALADKRVNNIALMGKYGSGKSSIIGTYFNVENQGKNLSFIKKLFNCSVLTEKNSSKRTGKDSRILRVSFATFSSQQNIDSKLEVDKQTTVSDSEIFANIINQIIYQIKPKKIPLTKFKIKRPLEIKIKLSACVEVLLIILWLLKPKNMDIPFLKNIDVIRYLPILIAILGSVILWNVLSRIEFSKLKISWKGNETEINLLQDKLFEKYIAEILYLFENTDKTILVIEDLDRFDDLRVFEKLRELNTKLNLAGDKHWRFIYLLKDEMFKNSKERVKFFDVIIPVIPFMTSNNSFDKLSQLFSNRSKVLLSILSGYIDDYRVLLNIYNEYSVYLDILDSNDRLQFSRDDKDQLLALIAYKNFNPKGFEDLQNGQGVLGNLIKSSLEDLNKKINDYGNQWDFNALEGDGSPEEREQNEELEQKIQEGKKKLQNFHLSSIKGYSETLQKENDNILCALIDSDIIKLNYRDIINQFYGDDSTLKFIRNLYSPVNNTNNQMLRLYQLDELLDRLEDNDYRRPQILNLDLAKWLKLNDLNHFQMLVQTAIDDNSGFKEKLLNDDPTMYENIIAGEEVQFDVTKLQPIKVLDIILNNRYKNNEKNRQQLKEWLKSLVNVGSAESLINILKSKNVYDEIKPIVIDVLPVPIKDIRIFDLKIQEYLVKEKKIENSFTNIINYYENVGDKLDENLIGFINQYHNVDFNFSGEDYNTGRIINFLNDTLRNAKLSYVAFQNIWMKCPISNFVISNSEQIENTSNERIQFLVEIGRVTIDVGIIKLIDSKGITVFDHRKDSFSSYLKDSDNVFDTGVHDIGSLFSYENKILINNIKRVIYENEISIKNQELLIELLIVDSEWNNKIFVDNLSILSVQQVINYANSNDKSLNGSQNTTKNKIGDKIFSIINENNRRRTGFSFVNNYEMKKLLEWLQTKADFDNFKIDNHGRLKPVGFKNSKKINTK